MFIHNRQQELITLLLQDKEWRTLEEISNYLNCSVKTVRRDLIYLKDYLPSEWKIQIEKGKGVLLYKPPHSSSTDIYLFFKQNDLTFQILDYLLQGKIHTVANLAEELYMQVSSVSIHLQNVEKYLNQFELQLHKKPLRIVGNEIHIIYMFYELYYTTYKLEDYPLHHKNEIIQFILNLEIKLNIQFYPTYKQKLVYLLAITLQRKKQGYKINISSNHITHIIDSPFYNKIKTISHTLCGIKLTEIDQVFITAAINCCLFSYSNIKTNSKYTLQYFYNKNIDHYQHIHNLISTLEYEFKIKLKHDQEFVFQLLQYIRQISYKYQFITINVFQTSKFHKKIKNNHYKTFCKVKKIYTKWIQQYTLIPYAHETDIIAMTLQLEAMLQLTKLSPKKALLYLGDSILWKRYIQGILHHSFGNTLSIIQEEILDIQTLDFQKLNVDFIITTIPFEEIKIPVIQISPVPTKRELNDIRTFLYNELDEYPAKFF
ncbi:BglG family transcription antiterminator [Bacillus cereus]|uniref:BglG family transcription antiterminator n=1 Tax=Bacillus cereus TaxID=1396 RepID=UPI000950ECDC|nr:helix-turn-helix domain-containing protein [Bacillus cereus]OLR27701.1 hypothetical protein BLD50_00240 [Bacillus cereus]